MWVTSVGLHPEPEVSAKRSEAWADGRRPQRSNGGCNVNGPKVAGRWLEAYPKSLRPDPAELLIDEKVQEK